jgi:hypothetical protein
LNIGNQAYEVVRTFSEKGIHRTGTQGDRDTARWLGSALTAAGADVEFQTFPYHHFDAELSVRSAGKSVDAEALYYSFAGQRNLHNPATGVVDAHADEVVISRNINDMVDAAIANGHDGLVLATRCPSEDLCAINREYRTEMELPVILVTEDDLHTIRTSGAVISIAASVRKREANNVIARFPGRTGARRIVVTTPISGWFQCAGERGCGLAVAIFVSKQLSKNFAVDLLLASGHELGFRGGFHLAESYDAEPGCVLHLGSCIANIDAQMTSICSADTETSGRIAGALQRLGIKPTAPSDPANAECWVGESMCWASNNWPMLSIAGQAPHFHSRTDLPDVVTTPDLVTNAIDAIGDAAFALASHEDTEVPKGFLP